MKKNHSHKKKKRKKKKKSNSEVSINRSNRKRKRKQQKPQPFSAETRLKYLWPVYIFAWMWLPIFIIEAITGNGQYDELLSLLLISLFSSGLFTFCFHIWGGKKILIDENYVIIERNFGKSHRIPVNDIHSFTGRSSYRNFYTQYTIILKNSKRKRITFSDVGLSSTACLKLENRYLNKLTGYSEVQISRKQNDKYYGPKQKLVMDEILRCDDEQNKRLKELQEMVR